MSDLMLFGILRMPYELAMADELSRRQFYSTVQSAANMLESSSKSCPCHWTEPCQPNCSCVNPLMSHGCDRCCQYGSDLQRKQQAEYIVTQRKYELVGSVLNGALVDEDKVHVNLKNGTQLYITKWTQEDIDAAKARAKEIWPEFDHD